MDSNVKVAIRCRPLSNKETTQGCRNIVSINGNAIRIDKVSEGLEAKEFAFDHCYNVDSKQEQVYADLGQPLLAQALDGFNGTIFAYGQTGSGKSFSMMGSNEHKGIIPQLNDNLWKQLAEIIAKAGAEDTSKYMITVSFLEIYNEVIKDLLNPSEKQMKIRESPKAGIYVEGLCELIVRDPADFLRLIDQGNAVRRVAATNMNEQSSRSHSCFTVKIERKTVSELPGGITRENLVKAKLNLVDLAGSERAEKTGATGATLKEGANINMSLMALGNVINALSEGGAKTKHIPYRDSKLTRLLQESLGGNSLTVMLAAISPADYNYDETVSTLKYASRAKSIANAVSRNEDSNERLIRGLKEEIEALKQQLISSGGAEANPEMESKLAEMEFNQRSAWEEKERLQKELEQERQANMNAVIANMMDSVKEQKVLQMKSIKRLTNEKAMVTKKFKDLKDANTALKSRLDVGMKRYQECQQAYDVAVAKGKQEEGKLEAIATEMATILSGIEKNRAAWIATKEEAKSMKARLSAIEEELTEERGNLVATAGMLDQNEKLRDQIQKEEREKAKDMIAAEIALAREKLEAEKAAVRGTIEGELGEEMRQLKTQISDLESSLKVEQMTVAELRKETAHLQKYVDTLENRLADAEVNQEYADNEVERLTAENEQLETLQNQVRDLKAEIVDLTSARAAEKSSFDNLVAQLQRELEEKIREEKAKQEAERYKVFRALMDGMNDERTVMQKKLSDVQAMLANAVRDVMFLNSQNEELRSNLQQAILWERPVSSPTNRPQPGLSPFKSPSLPSSVEKPIPTAGVSDTGSAATTAVKPRLKKWGDLLPSVGAGNSHTDEPAADGTSSVSANAQANSSGPSRGPLGMLRRVMSKSSLIGDGDGPSVRRPSDEFETSTTSKRYFPTGGSDAAAVFGASDHHETGTADADEKTAERGPFGMLKRALSMKKVQSGEPMSGRQVVTWAPNS